GDKVGLSCERCGGVCRDIVAGVGSWSSSGEGGRGDGNEGGEERGTHVDGIEADGMETWMRLMKRTGWRSTRNEELEGTGDEDSEGEAYVLYTSSWECTGRASPHEYHNRSI